MTVRRRPSLRRIAVAAAGALAAAGLSALVVQPAAQAAGVPAGFTETVAIGGLSTPTAALFGADGRVFIAEKGGVIKTYDSLADTSATVVADLSPRVHNFWDRGLLGLALDPAYPTRPYLYALYALDAPPGQPGAYPRWGDQCPTPPGATTDGCVITGQLSRLALGPNHVMTGENLLITDWCQQFPSHSIGTLAFGADGLLYVSSGDGASFNYVDYGQTKNLCGDPPGPAGTNLSLPAAEGGALRSQSVRRASAEQTTTLDGTVLRIDPDTGLGAPGNPFASSANPNKQRVIASGLRNPFRFTVRPGTDELWVADVGWNTWEEINRIPNASDAVADNFGWPCYEGAARQNGYDSANADACETLYAPGDPNVNAPYYAYNHSAKVVPTDPCPTGGSAATGIAFENGSNYPGTYHDALFFADYTRKCVWAMLAGANGLPDPARIVPFVTGTSSEGAVQLLTGPGGDLFYVAMDAGQLRRISYPTGNRAPTALATATPSSGPAPLTVQFDGTGSSDPDGDAITYEWDLDGDGAYDDSTQARPTFTYTAPAIVTVGLRVTDPAGAAGTTTVTVTVGQPPSDDPVPAIDTPSASLRWVVGQTIAFSGHATDPQDGTLPASALAWRLNMQHCSSASDCHTHVVQTFDGVSSGSFSAPDHSYPSYLELVLTATDSSGRSASTTLRLDPQTVTLSFATSPSGGLQLVVNGISQAAPFTRTVIVGSANSVSAPTPQNAGKWGYTFTSWSDGGAATHNVTAPASSTTYTAKYAKCVQNRPC